MAWQGALSVAMLYTNAKLLIDAYATRAGDAVLLKWCHLLKIEVHLPPKETLNSFQIRISDVWFLLLQMREKPF